MNEPVDSPEVIDNLDDFSAEFFGTGKPKEEVTEEVVEGEQEDTPATQDEPAEQETESDESDEEVGEEEGKFKVAKKLTARERIEQLNAKFREEERLRLATEARLAELERKLQNPEPEAKAPEKVEVKGPSPDDKDEKGEDKYPLGEYDPEYIRDLHRHEAAEAKRELEQTIVRQQQEAAKAVEIQQVATEWSTRVAAATERLPDLAEKAIELERHLSDTPQEIVESLAMTVMTLENGPDVLYYLAQNVEEARRIAQGGPQALIALGKIDAMVKPTIKAEVKKVTEAPEPPPRTRGVHGKFGVAPDTDDLSAFEREFFRRN